MHPIRKRRLIFIGSALILLATSMAFILYGLKQNINLFLTPTQLKQQPFSTRTIRLGGMVKKDSVVHAEDSLEVSFVVTDLNEEIIVSYQGVLPDLFREEKGVVVQGAQDKGNHFQATQVLAKHDENYMPPQIAKQLGKRGDG